MKRILLGMWMLVGVCCGNLLPGQSIYNERLHQFLSFESIPTWTAVATDWEKPEAQIHLYDAIQYKGHAQYISVALKTGITFAQFKEQVREPGQRKYMPFFLFDLRKKPPVIEGKPHAWAIRIEDYAYRDDAKQMTETTLRLLRTVQAYIRQATGKTTNGIIVLATNPESQPNVSLAPVLNQAGFPNKTTNQLVAMMGGKQVDVLNAGTGIGYLRYVKAGDESSFRATAQDIVIYAQTPMRVPPVNGIITLEAQTPLSHINLLAKNRGTFNLYALDTSAVPGLHPRIGKLTRVECTDQRITFHDATLKEAEAFWAKHQVKVVLPEPVFAQWEIVDLASLASGLLIPQAIGAKAANYAFIQQHYPQYVRRGFAIPFVHYQDAVLQSGAGKLIAALLAEKQTLSAAAIEQRLTGIRQAILNAKPDPKLLRSVEALAKAQYPGQRIRLRSSTNCEDLPSFNGAGLYLSRGLDADEIQTKLGSRILQIYAAVWTPHAWAEREYYFIDHSKVAMGILINEAYGSEYANGVVLTVPDKTDFATVVNSQYGEAAVTNPEGGQVPEALVFKHSADTKYAVESKSNIHDVFLQDSLAAALLELKALAGKVHRDFQARAPQSTGTGYGVDIEFKVVRRREGGFQIYIKQARLLGQVLPE
ncbi:MAG TPA: PEP/pyruvate-binding domain-containing protein [Bacteroidia bacterium]|nr:PEP/pyruvate-binding domain-containing protein [Bacteroidia bacterium]